MGEFPLALPESGPIVAYGWWDFVPGSSPRFVNRATGATIRYVGEFDSARVPAGEGEWRLFEYSDPDFSYPLVVRWRRDDVGYIHSTCVNWSRATSFSASLTIDYRVSEALFNHTNKSIISNFGAYVRVDDACRSIFTVWPIEPPSKKAFPSNIGLRIYGGWVAGEWGDDIYWARKRFSALGDINYGLSCGFELPNPPKRPEHSKLASFSMVSQPWFERSYPMESTPSDIWECVARNKFNCSGLMQLTPESDAGGNFFRLSNTPNFLQSEDGQAVVVLGAPKGINDIKKYAEFPIFPCYLFFEGVAYGFTLTGDFRIGWEGPLTTMFPKALDGFLSDNFSREYILTTSNNNRSYQSYTGGGFICCPNLGFWPIMHRMLTDAIWNASDRFFQNVCGYESIKSGDFIEPEIQTSNEYKRAHCEDDWVCGQYRTDLFSVFEKSVAVSENEGET